jgi:HEAT repeat protein
MSNLTDDENPLEGWVAQLLDEDEDRGYKATSALQRLGRPALERALELARDPRPRMRDMACRVLGQVVDRLPAKGEPWPAALPDGVPLLLELLESDPDGEVRGSAAAALGHQGLPSTILALCRAALDSSEQVRFDVAAALGCFGEWSWDDPEAAIHQDQVCQTLLRLMDDPDDDVRDWATFSMHQGGHDTPEVRARFWKALDDPYPEVRGEASEGLARLGDPNLAPRLEELLRNDPAISPCYFLAAEELGDPRLLPAVLHAAERWQSLGEEGEEPHDYITSAIEILQQAATVAGNGTKSGGGE